MVNIRKTTAASCLLFLGFYLLSEFNPLHSHPYLLAVESLTCTAVSSTTISRGLQGEQFQKPSKSLTSRTITTKRRRAKNGDTSTSLGNSAQQNIWGIHHLQDVTTGRPKAISTASPNCCSEMALHVVAMNNNSLRMSLLALSSQYILLHRVVKMTITMITSKTIMMTIAKKEENDDGYIKHLNNDQGENKKHHEKNIMIGNNSTGRSDNHTQPPEQQRQEQERPSSLSSLPNDNESSNIGNVSSSNNSQRLSTTSQQQQQQLQQQQPLMDNLTDFLSKKKPTDFLTVQDLQHLLQTHPRFMVPSELFLSDENPSLTSRPGSTLYKTHSIGHNPLLPHLPNVLSGLPTSTKATPTTSSMGWRPPLSGRSSTSSSSVAFPQGTVVKSSHAQWGIGLSSLVIGVILAMSVLPNLWLVGGLSSTLYGYKVGLDYANQTASSGLSTATTATASTTTWVSTRPIPDQLLIYTGQRLARFYWTIHDSGRVLWFMYKTGQLSYEYYQIYTKLDNQWHIQSKMDAWNERFQQGKIAFDQWERDHEVGRKLLAMARTVWLVGEEQQQQNRQRGAGIGGVGYTNKQRKESTVTSRKQSSRYRMIQYMYDTRYWIVRLVYRIQLKLAQGWIWIRNIILHPTTIRQSAQRIARRVIAVISTNENSIGTRIGAATLTVLLVYLLGICFAVLPGILGVVAAYIGFTYPNWWHDWIHRFQLWWRDENYSEGEHTDGSTTARSPTGQGQAAQQRLLQVNTKPNHPWLSSPSSTERSIHGKPTKIKSAAKYHYYETKNGQKRYYRVHTKNPWLELIQWLSQ